MAFTASQSTTTTTTTTTHFISQNQHIVKSTKSPYMILSTNLMTVKISKEKVPHTYKELIKRVMTLEYEKLLLLKSPKYNVASNIAITGRKEK